MTTLLLVEHEDGVVKDSTARALTAAAAIGGELHLLVAGHGCGATAESAAKLAGVNKVLVADSAQLAHPLAEPLSALIVSLAPAYDALIAAATVSGKNVMPRVAGLLDVMQISDITRVVGPDTFERPVYAGNAIETVRSLDSTRVVTVRSSAFKAAVAGSGAAPIEAIPVPALPRLSSYEGSELVRSERPDLASARIVISGGRAFQSAENFHKYLEPVADRLKAAIGASRAAVDAGYASNDRQVGQTGKVVAPELYIACGISGAIQHLAGMKDSKVIVAINKDPDAPIFQIADYCLVGDVFELLPQLERALADVPA